MEYVISHLVKNYGSKQVLKDVDFVFEDYGETCKGLESTVLLAIDENTKVLRQGSLFID